MTDRKVTVNERSIEHVGDGVWVATLDQDAMEDIVHFLHIGAHRTSFVGRVTALANEFQEALESAFPDGAQDPTPRTTGD